MKTLNIRIYYEDTDSAGVVYYANYLKFIERGRSEYLRQLGFEQSALNARYNIVFAVKNLVADYRFPARFDELITVKTQVQKSRFASIVFAQTIGLFGQSKVLFQAQIKVVCLEAKRLKPCAIPPAILTKILWEKENGK